MQRRWIVGLTSVTALLAVTVAQAAPIPAGQLMKSRTMTVSGGGSYYNPRIYDGEVFAVRIGAPYAVGRFFDGSTTPDAIWTNAFDVRMASPMGGGTNKTYVIGAGGNNNDYLTRFDYATLSNSVHDTVLGIRVNTFAWVDDDTIIASSYMTNIQNRLYLLDITAEPFAVALNTTWNSNGYVETPVEKRIRSVTVGDVYSGYAYFCDNSSLTNKLCAIDLASGVVKEIGSYERVTGDSYGSWTMKESGGYLYLQTVKDGIHVYNMIDAITLGSLATHHTKAQLDALMGSAQPSYGFDVVDDGQRMVLGVAGISAIELVQNLPYTDDFEGYDKVNVSLNSLGYRGWSASSNSVIVKSGTGVSGSKAAYLPGETSLTNTLYASVPLTKAWTDMQLKPVKMLGDPEVGSSASVMLYVNADGYAVVYDPDTTAWAVCSNNVVNAAVTPITDDTFVRITLYQDYVAKTVAVFVNDVLVREGLAMIGGAPASYQKLAVQNTSETNAYLDNVWISTSYPVDLTGDSNGNGWADAKEIMDFGSISATTNGVPHTWLADKGLVDPYGDADSDGLSNAEEYLAGTDPNDDASIFQILSIVRNGTETVLTITGNDSGATTPYVIERSMNLGSGFTDYDAAPRGSAPANTVYVDDDSTGAVFYRVKAVQ
ncbi:MAG: thrombospondin type 3 repeat-containing protein [Kiritimatiellia bacterium]